MIRPFTLRDLALVRRLSEQGISLHTESALTNSLHPLRGAVVNMLVGGDFPTYVWKAEKGNAAGFIQLLVEHNGHHAHIFYVSPTMPRPNFDNGNGHVVSGNIVDESIWLPLLDQAVYEAGQRGIYSLVAEVDETGAELPVLRHAGFAVYTRQDIWVINSSTQPNGRSDHKELTLTARQSDDDWEIQLLYANTVPRLVQLVEPSPPAEEGDCYLLRENDEVVAVVHMMRGPVATWLRLFVHPNAEAQADDIILSALKMKPPKLSHPVYCCVRRYQSWVHSALERSGFAFWGSQAVMVKHTVHHLQKPQPDALTAMEQQGIPASTPMIQRYRPNSPAQNNSTGEKEWRQG